MRNVLAEGIFWIHFAIVFFWYGLFFIPADWWQGKISFHFFFTVGIMLQQVLWGAILLPWTKRYKLVCVLTTIMQLLRGEKISSEKNYQHSWTREFLERMGLKIPEGGPLIVNLFVLFAVSFQYLLPKLSG